MTSKEIKRIRKRLDISRERFARLLDEQNPPSAGSIQNWETGKNKPSRVWVAKLELLRESNNVFQNSTEGRNR